MTCGEPVEPARRTSPPKNLPKLAIHGLTPSGRHGLDCRSCYLTPSDRPVIRHPTGPALTWPELAEGPVVSCGDLW